MNKSSHFHRNIFEKWKLLSRPEIKYIWTEIRLEIIGLWHKSKQLVWLAKKGRKYYISEQKSNFVSVNLF